MRFRVRSIVLAAILTTLGQTALAQNQGGECEVYGERAAGDAQQYRRNACGADARNPRWTVNADEHKNWCRTASPASAQSEDANRRETLAKCSICRRYAIEAKIAAEVNVKRKCGLTGPRWGRDQAPHFDWCMSLELDTENALFGRVPIHERRLLWETEAETKERLFALSACPATGTPAGPLLVQHEGLLDLLKVLRRRQSEVQQAAALSPNLQLPPPAAKPEPAPAPTPASTAPATTPGAQLPRSACTPPNHWVNGHCCTLQGIAAGTCGETQTVARVGTAPPAPAVVETPTVQPAQKELPIALQPPAATQSSCPPPRHWFNGQCCTMEALANRTCGGPSRAAPGAQAACQRPNRIVRGQCCTQRGVCRALAPAAPITPTAAVGPATRAAPPRCEGKMIRGRCYVTVAPKPVSRAVKKGPSRYRR